jgi:hypothetical protein
VIGQIKDILTANLGYSQDLIDRFSGILNAFRNPARRFYIPDGAVIADFYIPYLCCSDCPPVAYITQAPPPTVVFDIQPRTFLFDDAHNYPFTVEPPVAEPGPVQKNFTSPDLDNPNGLTLMTDEKGILYLHPAMDIKATLPASLTYKKTVTVDIKIIVPDASFQLTVVQSTDTPPQLQLQLTAKIQDSLASYSWDVNGQTNIFNPVASPPAVNVSKLFINQDISVSIGLTVTYNLNGAISSDTKTVELTPALVKQHADGKPFELPYE